MEKYRFSEGLYQKIILFFDKTIYATVSSPPKKGLQSVNEDSPRLINQDADILHSMVTKVL